MAAPIDSIYGGKPTALLPAKKVTIPSVIHRCSLRSGTRMGHAAAAMAEEGMLERVRLAA
jgi:hypothetical protein